MLLIALSFGNTVNLSFGGDDFTALYYAQKHLILPYPYYADSIRESLLYRLFGLTAWPYYVTSVMLFGVVTALVAYLAHLLFKKRSTTLWAALFFIFSFVGSGAMYSAAEAIRNTTYLMLQLTTLCLLFLFTTRGRRWHYISSFALFGITAILFPYRAFTLILLLPLMTLFYHPKRMKKGELFRLFLPFFLLAVAVYVLLPRLPFAHDIRQISPAALVQKISLTGILHYALTLLFLFIPDTAIGTLVPVNAWLLPLEVVSLVFFVTLVLFVYSLHEPALRTPIRFLFLSLLLTLAGFFTFSTDYYQTSYRYLITLRPFLSLLFAGIAMWTLTRTRRSPLVKPVVSFLLIALLFIQTREHILLQRQEVAYRGTYVRNAVATIRQTIPELHDYSIFFVDGKTNELRDQFMAAFRVGFLPSGASLAIYYHTTYDTIEITDRIHCDNFASLLKRWKGKKITIYYFLATPNGVVRGDPKKAFELCAMDASGI